MSKEAEPDKSQSSDKNSNNGDKKKSPKVVLPPRGQKFSGPGVQKNG